MWSELKRGKTRLWQLMNITKIITVLENLYVADVIKKYKVASHV